MKKRQIYCYTKQYAIARGKIDGELLFLYKNTIIHNTYMSKIIGIDLGTTNSAVAVMESSGPEILENAEGARTTPSVVAIAKTKERLVGVAARRQAVTNPANTVYGIKRFIGHAFDDKAVQEDVKNASFSVKKSSTGGVSVVLGDKEYSPEEVSAMVLRKLKEDAEARLGGSVTEAVITTPAYFNDAQRKATKDAGKIAGLEVKRIINEPTAAALAYGFDKKKNEKIAVFDFGGGTFDVSILQVGDDIVEVKSTGGDSHLGGRDIDREVLNYVVAEYKKESGVDLSEDSLAVQRLDEEVERAKKELSQSQETEINIPFITSTSAGPQHLLITLTRAKLEELAKRYIDKTLEITKGVLSDASASVSDVNEVILVGGQTRMPAVIKAVEDLFGKQPNRSINPDEVVALGAAIQGGILSGDVRDVLLLDVTPLSLGIETLGGVATKVIEKNTTLPTSASQVFSTAADNQSSVEIHIVQGERSMATDNKSLGRFILDGIDNAPRGMPQIEVEFDLDTDGILNVTAKDKKTNKTQSIKIEARSGLSDEDIEQMKQSAEAHADEDIKKKELIEVRNIAEQAVYEGEKIAKQDNLSADAKKEVEDAITKLRAEKEKDDKETIQQAITEASGVFAKHRQASTEGQTADTDGTATPSDKDTSESSSNDTDKEDGKTGEQKEE